MVVGSSSWAANSFISFNGNSDLALNAMNWLSSDEDLISIRPKPPEDRKVNMTGAQFNWVRLSSQFLLAGGALAGGPLRVVAEEIAAASISCNSPRDKNDDEDATTDSGGRGPGSAGRNALLVQSSQARNGQRERQPERVQCQSRCPESETTFPNWKSRRRTATTSFSTAPARELENHFSQTAGRRSGIGFHDSLQFVADGRRHADR